MYPVIKRTVSSTKNGAYKKKYQSLDFEMLPWVQWLDIEPLTNDQQRVIRFLYPVLLQEINTKKPSRLLHFLVGKGVLFWQDLVIIQHQRLTDLERNSPLLRILLTRGQEGYYSLMEGLRSRYGSWQGYLADLLAAKYDLATVRVELVECVPLENITLTTPNASVKDWDVLLEKTSTDRDQMWRENMMDIFKIVCHDIVKINPLGWTGLLRKLGLSSEDLEQCRRQNKLLCNQVLHALFTWMGRRRDKNQLLAELLDALRKIGRSDIADGISVLIITVHAVKKPHGGDEEDEVMGESLGGRIDSAISSGLGFTQASDGEDVFDETSSITSPQRPASTADKRFDSGLGSDAGFETPSPMMSRRSMATLSPHPPPSVSRILNKRSTRHWKGSRSARQRGLIAPVSTVQSIQSGKVFEYGLSPRTKTNAWEKRKPSILQFDYMTQNYFDNLFMDHMVHQ